MYSFLIISDKASNSNISFINSLKNNKLLWTGFLWIMLTTFSGTAMIILAIVLLKYLSFRNSIIIGTTIIVLFSIGLSTDFKPLKRVTSFMESIITLDPQRIIEADPSAAVRVVPDLLCYEKIKLNEPKYWIVGEGIDSSKKWLYKHVKYMGDANYGGMGKFMIEYGIVVAILYLLLTFLLCYNKRNRIPSITFWILCVFFNGVNSQIAWLCILMLFINKDVIAKRFNSKKLTLAINRIW